MIILWTLAALAAEPIVLSYDGALQQAVERNPSLVLADEDLRSADGALLAARGGFDPALSGSGTAMGSTSESTQQYGEVLSQYHGTTWDGRLSQFFASGTTAALDWTSTRSRFKYELRDTGYVVESDEPLHNQKLTASLSQSLLRGFKLSYNLQGVRQARRSRDAADLALHTTREQVLADTASAYWALYAAQRLADLAEQSVAVAEEEQRVVDAQVEQGQQAPVERARVKATVVQARSALIDARNSAAAAADALLLSIGEEPGRPVQLVTQPQPVTTIHLDPLDTVSQALAHNPEVLSARLSEEIASQDLSDARHARLPQLDATGSYSLSGYDTSPSAAVQEIWARDLPEWTVGANFSLPLGNRAARGSYLSAQASLARARTQREALERSVSQQVRAQIRTLESARAKVELAQANLALAEETLAADRALQAAGRAIQRDVLTSIKNVDDAGVAVEQAQADFQLAIVELKRLQGGL